MFSPLVIISRTVLIFECVHVHYCMCVYMSNIHVHMTAGIVLILRCTRMHMTLCRVSSTGGGKLPPLTLQLPPQILQPPPHNILI